MRLAAMIWRISPSLAPAARTESIKQLRVRRSIGAPRNRDESESTSSCRMPVDATSVFDLTPVVPVQADFEDVVADIIVDNGNLAPLTPTVADFE